MGGFSIWHWLIVGIVVILLFGKGRISDVMGDLAKGIKSFKKGLSEDETPAPPRQIGPASPDQTIRSETPQETPRS
ncbi:twin-arginine translocase TatA/TatE family subunit [Sphingosinicella sp.]|jgi:sec-independent protein translocase protein TatA|uniref:twin-arginine translocase TatA/TatE family subunit n=1 Tax=Sphingosinicella sp. TaxID=1917971 RepID=UPI0017BE89CE|nr:twin-arginine translocase TatA/TatE family subunit [Sphingosinicella sp.]MBA4756924.1 twin-arginine translocase TatA/TatE family subunit [Sphingosinicella sp.]MEA3538154.1 twin-arginine translocase TatA/TatE family subunit [Pseudomonadota bacterium]